MYRSVKLFLTLSVVTLAYGAYILTCEELKPDEAKTTEDEVFLN